MSNIYVASSWRNPWQPAVVQQLRTLGHEVYDFREPEPGVSGFAWSDISPVWQQWRPAAYRRALSHEIAEDGFRRDMDALRACDACVLVLPCGNSAHLELGWAVGAGRQTAVLFPFGFPIARIGGHSCDSDVPCQSCGDIDGCHLPGRLNHIEPELMAKAAGQILIHADELAAWVAGGFQ